MSAELVRRGGGEEEPGIEALGQALRRDPVCVRHERIEYELEAIVGEYGEEADLVLAERNAMRIGDLAGARGIHRRRSPLRPRQQDAAFLESLADRRDPETEIDLGKPLAARIKVGTRHDLPVAG